jgi:hypothetical protein
VEDQIEVNEKLMKQIELDLVNPDIFTDEGKLNKTNDHYEKVKKVINSLNDQWAEIGLRLEELEAI